MNDKKTEHADGAQGEREAFEAAFPYLSHERYVDGVDQYVTDFENGAWLAWQARAALAQPSPAESALRDAMAYGTGIISNGEHVPLAEALQPSPAPEQSGASTMCHGCFEQGVSPDHFDEAGKCKARQAPELDGFTETLRTEVERVFGYGKQDYRGCMNATIEQLQAQHDRIVVALRAAHQLTLDELHAMEVHVAQAGRDIEAAQARVAELEKQEPIGEVIEGGDAAAEAWLWPGREHRVGTKLYAAPVAQAGQVPDRAEFLAWAEKVLNDEQERLLAEDYLMDSDDCIKALHEAAAQAQGSDHHG